MRFLSAPPVVVVFAALLLTDCASSGSSGRGTDDGNPAVAGRPAESTGIQAGGGDLTGFITEIAPAKGGPVVLVEEDPDANCRRERDLRRNPCQKQYLSIVDKTRVLRGREGVQASASDLKKGQKVIGTAGDAVATSYPSQGTAERIVILKPPPPAG